MGRPRQLILQQIIEMVDRKNGIEINSINNEGDTVAERFITTLKNKNCMYMTSISKKYVYQ